MFLDRGSAVQALSGPGGGRRYAALDSLRGVAAFGVLLTHILQLVVADGTFNHTPLRILVNGRCFVVFFFVLSGFVLATAIWNDRGRTPYSIYVARRFVRLYPPYAIAGLLGVAVAGMIGVVVDLPGLAAYLLTLGTSKGVALDKPSWSLVYELRLSLLMPLICMLIDRSPRRAAIIGLVLFVMEEAAIKYFGVGQFPYAVDDPVSAVAATARYAVCFWLGALMALDGPMRRRAVELVAGRPVWASVIAFCLMSVLLDQTSMVGSAIVILLAIEWASLKSLLAWAPLQWLGRVSYSLYLTHFIVVDATFHALGGRIPAGLIAIVAGAVGLVVAEIFYRGVEWPSLQLSRRLKARPKVQLTVAGS